MELSWTSFWSELSGWNWANFAGIVMVTFAVFGEVVLLVRKPKPSPYARYSVNDPASILPVELFAGRLEWELKESKKVRLRHCQEVVVNVTLVVGLLLEMVAFVPSIREAWIEKEQLRYKAEILEATNLTLRGQIVELEKRMQPRVISPKKVKDFIFLTERMPKVPIKICIGQDGEDTWSYAIQLRDMFTQAGFSVDSSARDGGITRDSNRILTAPIGETNRWPDVIVVTYGTNKPPSHNFPLPPLEITNGFTRPILTTNDSRMVASVCLIFQQIRIDFKTVEDPLWVGPGEFAILVPIRRN